MHKHVRVVGQENQREEGVGGDKRHHHQVEVNHLSDKLLPCVREVVVERRSPPLGNLFGRLFQGVPRRAEHPAVGEDGGAERYERHGAVEGRRRNIACHQDRSNPHGEQQPCHGEREVRGVSKGGIALKRGPAHTVRFDDLSAQGRPA